MFKFFKPGGARVGALLLAAGMLVSACGTAAPTETPVPAPTATTPAMTAPTTAPTTAAAPGGKTLRVGLVTDVGFDQRQELQPVVV